VLIYFCEKLMKLKLLFTLRLLQNPIIRKSASAFFFASRPAHLSPLFALRALRPAPCSQRLAPRAPLRPNHRFQTFNKKGTEKNKTKVLIYFCEKLMKLKLLFTPRLLQNPIIRKSASACFFASRLAPRSSLISHRSSLFAPCAPRPAPSASRPASSKPPFPNL
jgi:hypothetical protein